MIGGSEKIARHLLRANQNLARTVVRVRIMTIWCCTPAHVLLAGPVTTAKSQFHATTLRIPVKILEPVQTPPTTYHTLANVHQRKTLIGYKLGLETTAKSRFHASTQETQVFSDHEEPKVIHVKIWEHATTT
jgi:hypothetical protein